MTSHRIARSRTDTPPDRRRWVAAALLAAAPFVLTGCESIMVATGMRMRLDGVPLQAVTATLTGDGRLAPGGSARLSVVATTTDGRTLATAGTGDGKVLADSYVYEADVVTVDADGRVKLPDDPRLSEGRIGHVRVHPKGQAAPVAEVDIPIRYDIAYKASYAAPDGANGFDGLPGQTGSSGNTGSFDPANPAPGEDGGTGGDGSDGDNGGDGSPGPDVHVVIAPAPGTHPLLRVRASASGHDRYYLLDPEGGSLALDVHGGSPGRGGRGGQPGPGGSGGAGSPSGMNGQPGMFAGHDGRDGMPGAAGHVVVDVDPAAARWLDRFHFTNADGDGRPGPAPVITVAPVPSPW
jgi:hypothetical protein